MTTRLFSSFLLLGFFSCSIYAAECSQSESIKYFNLIMDFADCTEETQVHRLSNVEYCNVKECRDLIEEIANYVLPGCTATFGDNDDDVNDLLESYNRTCGTELVRVDLINTAGDTGIVDKKVEL